MARQPRIHVLGGRYHVMMRGNGGDAIFFDDGDSSLFELVRDIHLNPCRAGWVADPADYPWSGDRAYPGQEDLPWLTSDWVLTQFSPRKAAARRRYAIFVTQGLRDPCPKALHLGGEEDSTILGPDRFVDEVMKRNSPRL